jgi:ABC-type hemin transport system substrate-binding protein
VPRIVTLLAAATEIVAAVGAGDELSASPTSATTHPRPWPAGPC